MATQQTNDTDEQRTQLVLEITPALRRRIERAAARDDLSASEYAARLLEQTVPEEEEEEERTETTRQPVTAEYLDRLREFQEQWAKNHPGVVIEDTVEMIRRMREERTEHLERVIRGE